ncbi:MAG TPA: hypothetical protein VFN92_12140 [Solirubrobacterales bacterium]|nr:hypothetical protein [Solirubrobacterales bacterium]
MSQWQEEYPAVGRALAPEYRSLPREDVEAVLEASFGEGFGLDQAEGFLADIGRTLGKVAQVAAPVVQRILPGLASGALGGAALGPLGAIGGALIGGIGGALGSKGPARPAPRPAAPGPAAVPAAASPGGAVGTLLAALGSPTVQQALGAMMLGRAGSRSVPTPNGGQLPVAAVTSLLGMLANRASAEWEETFAAEAPSGETAWEGLDLAAPEARAEWVLGQLAPLEGTTEEATGDEAVGDPEPGGEASDEGWIDELYDELEEQMVASDEAAYGAEAERWSLSADG